MRPRNDKTTDFSANGLTKESAAPLPGGRIDRAPFEPWVRTPMVQIQHLYFTASLLQTEVAHLQCSAGCGIDQSAPMIQARDRVLLGAEGIVAAYRDL
jgi:hypothetical protein